MEELEYDHDLIANRTKADAALFVTFFTDAVEDAEKSQQEGRKVFRDAEMIRIIVPGDKRNIVVREVRQDDKQRFADRYERWKKNEEEVLTGYPLSQWPAVTKAQLEELKYFGFRTVEDVANCPDSITTRFVGFQVLKRRAQTFLDVQAQNAPTEKLQAEVKVRDEQIAGMQNVINELQTKVNELLKASGKK